jgi:hypothetical protein
MMPDYFRNRWGFAGLNVASVALFSATPALSAPLSAAQVTGMTPLTIALGAIGFGLVASALVRRAHRRGEDMANAARLQLSSV